MAVARVPAMAGSKQRSLDIHEHLDFQRRFRVFRLAGTTVLVLLLLAALAGLLGPGPLSSTRASAGPVHVEYERFMHREHPAHLQVQWTGNAGELTLQGGLADDFDITHLTPQPDQAVRTSGELRYRFAPGTTSVLLEVKPIRAGNFGGRIGIGGDSVELRGFVYP